MANPETTLSAPLRRERMDGRLRRFYVYSSIAILLLMGAAKIVDVLNGPRALLSTDPLFGIGYGRLMLIAAVIEIGVALACLRIKEENRVVCILVLASALAAYRLGLWMVDWQQPCSCMGRLSDGLNISPETAGRISLVILAYFLVFGYINIIITNITRRRSEA
jgi:hypothetical protein